MKFKEGLEFMISKVSLKDEVEQEYQSTPLKICIHLDKTTCVPVLQTRGAIQPAPKISCAECIQMQQSAPSTVQL